MEMSWSLTEDDRTRTARSGAAVDFTLNCALEGGIAVDQLQQIIAEEKSLLASRLVAIHHPI
jgi:hypothetical protein